MSVGTATPAEDHNVFVSYAREDQPFVRRLAETLSERGKRTWVDWADIPSTAEWMTEIRDAIDAANTFVVVLSPACPSRPPFGHRCPSGLDGCRQWNEGIERRGGTGTEGRPWRNAWRGSQGRWGEAAAITESLRFMGQLAKGPTVAS
jgi:hypothetical protein